MRNLLGILFLSFCLILVANQVALSQEEAVSPEVTQMITEDEEVLAEDLEESEPKVLPDNPFYFLKNWQRGIRTFFAFSPLNRAKLQLKFANEKILEARKLAELKKDPKIIEKILENFQADLEKNREETENLRQRLKAEDFEKFAEKLLHQQLLHQKILEKLENQVPPEVSQKIKEQRERHLERFAKIIEKVEEKFPGKLEEVLARQKGSMFKNFRNLERLIEIEEKVPEEAKEAIQRAQENALKRLQGDLEKMNPEDQERFKEYLENISGNRETQIEILENLKEQLKEKPELKEKLLQIREGALEKIKERIQERNCPVVEKPAPGFCQEGRIVIKRDYLGCLISFECVIPAEIEIPPSPEKPQACITLWDPVCGEDGKTYSNECFAKLAEVEILHKGECEKRECETDADCPLLRCGFGIRCLGVKSKCVEGKCQVVPK